MGPWTDLRAQPPRLVFHTADGGVEVVDATNGEVLAHGRLGQQATDTVLSTAGGQLLQAGGGTLEAFDLATLAWRWRVWLPDAGYFATSCGPVLCVFGPRSMTGVDPATGAVLWHTHVWLSAYALPGGRLLTSGAEPDPPAIVAASTLRPVLDLGRWQAVGGEPAAVAPMVLTRDAPDLRTWFGVLDPAAPHPVVRALGWGRGVLRDGCSATGGYVACPTVHNELQVWTYIERSPLR
jgi:hypothetical protein